MTEYVKTFKEYKTQFIWDLFNRIDYEKDRIAQYPDKAIETMIVNSANVLFMSPVSVTEYEGISSGAVIKTDEANTLEALDSAYFLTSEVKTLDPAVFAYHHQTIFYVPQSKVFANVNDCRKARETEIETAQDRNAGPTPAPQTNEPLEETQPDAPDPKAAKFTFDKARTIRNAWTSFKVGYAILRQENLPDNVLAALYEMNTLRKRYRRMKMEKLKEIVAAKHGISVGELTSALQSRVNYMKHAKRAFQKIWSAE